MMMHLLLFCFHQREKTKKGKASHRQSFIAHGDLIVPTIPNSSASQLQRRIVLRGFHPNLLKRAKRRAISSKAAVPLFGSTAPKLHASL